MQFSYFKRYSRFSIGGYSSHIERKTAKQLITRFKGKIKKEYRLPAEGRVIELTNGNTIFAYIY